MSNPNNVNDGDINAEIIKEITVVEAKNELMFQAKSIIYGNEQNLLQIQDHESLIEKYEKAKPRESSENIIINCPLRARCLGRVKLMKSNISSALRLSSSQERVNKHSIVKSFAKLGKQKKENTLINETPQAKLLYLLSEINKFDSESSDKSNMEFNLNCNNQHYVALINIIQSESIMAKLSLRRIIDHRARKLLDEVITDASRFSHEDECLRFNQSAKLP